MDKFANQLRVFLYKMHIAESSTHLTSEHEAAIEEFEKAFELAVAEQVLRTLGDLVDAGKKMLNPPPSGTGVAQAAQVLGQCPLCNGRGRNQHDAKKACERCHGLGVAETDAASVCGPRR